MNPHNYNLIRYKYDVDAKYKNGGMEAQINEMSLGLNLYSDDRTTLKTRNVRNQSEASMYK